MQRECFNVSRRDRHSTDGVAAIVFQTESEDEDIRAEMQISTDFMTRRQ